MFLAIFAAELFKLSPVDATADTLATVLREQISASDLASSRQVWNPGGMTALIVQRTQDPAEPGWRFPHTLSDAEGHYRGMVTFGYWGDREHCQVALSNYSRDLLQALRTCVNFYREKDKATLKGAGTLKISVHADFEEIVKAVGFTIVSRNSDDVIDKWFKARSNPELMKELEGRVGPASPKAGDHLRIQGELTL